MSHTSYDKEVPRMRFSEFDPSIKDQPFKSSFFKKYTDTRQLKTQIYGVAVAKRALSLIKGSDPLFELAVKDYRDKRENGYVLDNPPRAFPRDGTYEFITPNNGDVSEIHYKPGTEDSRWMDEKDSNFLERTRQVVYDTTPLPVELIMIATGYLRENDTFKDGEAHQPEEHLKPSGC